MSDDELPPVQDVPGVGRVPGGIPSDAPPVDGVTAMTHGDRVIVTALREALTPENASAGPGEKLIEVAASFSMPRDEFIQIFGRLVRDVQREPRATRPVAAAPDPPRNAPCPCGSGRKFKQCHGAPGADT